MVNGHQVETRNTAHFRHDYGSDQSDLRRLYEQAKADQWNAARDIDWAVPLAGDGGLCLPTNTTLTVSVPARLLRTAPASERNSSFGVNSFQR